MRDYSSSFSGMSYLNKGNHMKKFHPANRYIAVLPFLVLVFFSVANSGHSRAEKSGIEFKNVIVMVPDGGGQSVVTLSRWWNGKALALDSDLSGAVRTYMSDSVITDSAAAATAFATGYKTSNRFVGVGPAPRNVLSIEDSPPESLQYRPLATVLEAAKLTGKATGLVVTSSVTHATPAAFAAHIHDRGMDNEIMEHLVYQDIDVVFGGGRCYLIPIEAGGKRTDDENLLQVLRNRNYEYVESKEAMNAATGSRVWGMFAGEHMEADVDRDEFAPQQPALAEMTAKAIGILSGNKKGFLLLVEGSQVDWAGHDNDPYYGVTEFLAFDNAYRVAKEFARRDGRTLVIVFPDHNTGGMTIGRQNAAVGYSETVVENLLEPLGKMHSTRSGITSTGLDRMIETDILRGMSEAASIRKNLQVWWGIEESDKGTKEIMQLTTNMRRKSAIGEVISRNHTVIGWTTHGHTGEDVPLWVFGENKSFGVVNNTDLAGIIADAMGVNLDHAGKVLFVDAKKVFPDAELDMSNAANPVLRIRDAVLPISKDILEIDDRKIQLEGLVVYAPLAPTDTPLPAGAETGRVYIPRQAVHAIKREIIFR
jgi:alkaline phosphatase